jgi:hypothetical protein
VSRKPEEFCNLPGAGYTAAMKSRFYSCLAALALAHGAAGQTPPPAKMTAFALARAGDKFIDPKARDRITQIHSEKSTGGLVPDIWYVEYFDPTASFKRTEVKFVGGKKAEIKQPRHLLDAFSGTKQLSWKKLKFDSDRALAIAVQEPLLKKLDLQAAQYWLERTTIGSSWKIRFWTTRLGKPGELSEVGDIYISSGTGAVLKKDLHF